MRKVMIVDDTKLMRNILKDTIVSHNNCRIIEASNGKEAIEKYKSERPDIVTMDITMDSKNGLEAATEILTFDPNAKIIMVTSLGQQKMLRECVQAGVTDYIVKPFTRDRILSSVQQALG